MLLLFIFIVNKVHAQTWTLNPERFTPEALEEEDEQITTWNVHIT